jgi:NAD(P)H-dependent FMN reductase
MITIVSGTNRKNSHTLMVAKFYQKEFLKRGIEVNLFSLEDLPPTIIVSDLYGARSEAFKPIQEMISKTDKFLFVIPEYNGSFPGVLKVFIDACSFPESFYGKKAALTGVSSGKYGNIRGIDHFTGVCNYCHMHVLPLKLHIPLIRQELDENQLIVKEDTLKFISEQIDKFLAF